jgi:hypothetical protein
MNNEDKPLNNKNVLISQFLIKEFVTKLLLTGGLQNRTNTL